MKKVVVVILNWNGGDLTPRCILSLQQSDYANLEYIVIDNGSTDGSPDEIAKAFPTTQIIRNPTNFGFAEGCNQGSAWGLQRGADYVMMLNNDTRVDASMVSNLVELSTAYQDRAAVVPKIYWESDPSRLWFAAERANLWTGVFSNVAFNRVDDGCFNFPGAVEFVVGCCILIPRKIFEGVGGFDGAFFAYMEDVDWSLRCRSAGFILAFCPTAKLWHAVSATGKKRPARIRYLMTRNHLWTMRRHANLPQILCFFLLLPLRSMMRISKSIAAREWQSIPAELKGIRDGLLTQLPEVEFQPSFARDSNL